VIGTVLRIVAFAATIAVLAHPTMAADAAAKDAQPPATTIADRVERLAPSYGLDPALVLAIIRAESAFDPTALSPKQAKGLMQLTPETALRFGVPDAFDAAQNLHGGMSYLRWLLDRFDGKTNLALAAYNAGEGAVLRHGGVPPFPETLDYVAKVSRYYADGDLAAASRAAPRRRPLPVVYRGIAVEEPRAAEDPPRIERARSGVLILRGRGPT
jgi:soluble lytic murein transglycosylase-like protein